MMQVSREEQIEKFRNKYIDYFEKHVNPPKLKKTDNYWKIIDNVYTPFEKCATCHEYKPRTPEYFYPDTITRKGGYDKWLQYYEPGRENFHNSKSMGCKECYVTKKCRQTRIDTVEFWRIRSNSFPTITKTNLKQKYDSQQFGPISGIPMYYMPEQCGHLLSPGVHDIEREHVKNNTKYNQANHTIEGIVLDLAMLNVGQFNRIECIITCTIEAYKNCIEYYSKSIHDIDQEMGQYQSFFIDWYKKTPVQCGVAFNKRKQSKEYHRASRVMCLRIILGEYKLRYTIMDNDKNRYNEIDNSDRKQFLFDTFINEKCICAICKTPLEFDRTKWNYASFDRIDNSKGHFIHGNLQLVCSLHQVAGQAGRYITHDMYIHMLLVQKHVQVPVEISNKLKLQHKHCPLCDIQKL